MLFHDFAAILLILLLALLDVALMLFVATTP